VSVVTPTLSSTAIEDVCRRLSAKATEASAGWLRLTNERITRIVLRTFNFGHGAQNASDKTSNMGVRGLKIEVLTFLSVGDMIPPEILTDRVVGLL
jgi:hypothetical protein